MIDQLSPVTGVRASAAAAAPAAAGPLTPPTEFTAVLGGLVADTVGSLRAAEATSILGVRGQVPVQQVVETVMSAEQNLQAALAVRDKIVAAYLELSRMAI
jgi:flagellar hook-basal body complex protein FliE